MIFASIAGLLHQHPEVGVVALFVAAVCAHVAVGALLHAFRIHDFDLHKLGAFVEQDFATVRGLAILTTAALTFLSATVNGSDFRAAWGVSFSALVMAVGAATLPVVRDTVREFVLLVSGYQTGGVVAFKQPKPV